MPTPVNPSPIPQQSPADDPRNETHAFSAPANRSDAEPNFAPADHPGELGRLGRYRVLKKLGQGGMGTVYLGFDTGLSRKVALKVMRPQIAADSRVRERFLREARSAAQVKSDHVVTIFDVGEEQGLPFIAMEYLQGCTLAEYLTTRGRVSIAQAIRIGRETAQGLLTAHARGLVHRDIKPANLWLEAPRGRVKILDFGLARQESQGVELTQTGVVVGTPAFMSPEQARANRVDQRSDLFSLGSVLYLLLSGKLPFAGETTIQVLSALALEEPAPLRQLNPEVPEALANLVQQLLHKEPEKRIQSAKDVVAALQTIAGSLSADSRNQPDDDCIEAARIGAATDEVWPGVDPVSDEHTAALPLASTGKRRSWLWLGLTGGILAVVLTLIFINLPRKETPGVDGDPKEKLPPIKADPVSTSKWVLSIGGSITIRDGDTERELKSTKATLPARFLLKRINLADRQITDREMGYLNNLPDLDYLSLKGTPISDAALNANLEGLPKLTQLELGNTNLTNEALACLKRLPKVHSVWLDHSRFGDSGMRQVKDIAGLKRLYLEHSAITDAGLEPLKDIPDLWELSLSHTAITDAGLLHLHSMKSLHGISLQSTRITADGLKKLREALPKCNIGADPGKERPRKRS
jgi:serine/threonine protein kinase